MSMESMPMSIQPSISPTAEQITELRFAASKMHGSERRAFVAQIALKYCNGNARQTEQLAVGESCF